MKISLISPTYNRPDELVRLLESYAENAAEGLGVEALVVDQYGDGRYEHLCEPFRDRFEVTYLRSERNSIPCARNLGLDELDGDVFAIPDDDCVYPPGTLERVARFFRDNPEYDVLVGRPESIGGGRRLLRTPATACEIFAGPAMLLGIAYTCFYRVTDRLPRFDKRFGIGEEFGSGCDADFLVTALKEGARGWFDPELVVLHPDKEIHGGATDHVRERLYGTGLGALYRKHMCYGRVPGMLPGFLLTMTIRPVGGAVLGLLRLKPRWALLHLSKLVGRWQGFISYRPEGCAGNIGGAK